MYTPLSAETVVEYVRQSPVMDQIFSRDDQMAVVDLSEGGNVNLIFRVHSLADPNRSVLVKQALPYARRYPDGMMPLERAKVEYDLLTIEETYCPGFTPKVYHYDGVMHVNLMEDLNQHLNMRFGLSKGIVYPKFGQDAGRFLARTLFYTSDLYLPSDKKKAMVSKFINPVLCKVTEHLFFNEPCKPHPNNRWTSPQLDQKVQAIYANPALQGEMLVMKEKFMTQAQALVHGDFHTGSVLLNPEDTRFIDPEFAFYGPIAFDVGSMLGNLIIGYAAQEYYAPDSAARDTYRQWILETVAEIWNTFEQEFRQLWAEDGDKEEWDSAHFREHYMAQFFTDTLGYAAAEIFRRTIGMAWVDDFVGIKDLYVRAKAESLALTIAEHWLLKRREIESIEAAISWVGQAETGIEK
ncbi:MAG: S-methyl-5-thioribose kinase [Anaerolineae bacterium]